MSSVPNYSNAVTPKNDVTPEGLAGFDAAEAAPEFAPLPPGIYRARVLRGEVCTTKAGAEAYRIRFEVVEGEQVGRTVQRMWTFSAKAMAYSKRDLAAFGLTTAAHLLSPFPPTGKDVIVELAVALQQSDNGSQFNDVKSVRVLEVKPSAVADYVISEEDTE